MAKPTIKQYVFKKAAARGVPVSGTFELTSRCNLNCRMCYIRMTEEEQRRLGRELTAEEWINVGKQAAGEGMLYLLLTGGEPLIRSDFIRIYTELIGLGIMISVNTNATHVTPEIAECFRQYPPEAVNVTLYGSSNETYRRLCGAADGLSRAMNGICALQAAGVRVNLNTTLTSLNIGDSEELIRFARERGLPIRTAAYVFPKVRNGMGEQTVTLSPEEHGIAAARFELMSLGRDALIKKRARILRCLRDAEPAAGAESKPSACMAGRGAFWVCWDGSVYPCGMLPMDGINIRDADFSACRRRLQARMPSVLLPAECSTCRYSPICPVCAALTQSINGNTSALPKEMCRYIKAYSNAFLEATEGLGEANEESSSDASVEQSPCIL